VYNYTIINVVSVAMALRMAGKWDSHTAVFWRRGTPEIGVTVFHCQGEERERNTRDSVMYRERGEGLG